MIATMGTYARNVIKVMTVYGLLGVSMPAAAGPNDISGTWRLNEGDSETLNEEVKQLKQEHRDWSTEHGSINDPEKPDPFAARRQRADSWDSRRGGAVGNASVTVRQMVSAALIKLYISERIIIAYDGKLKRLINPNPYGRVHSATGKGLSKDAIGETLAYVEGDAVVIETRTTSAERMTERFELTSNDRLQLTTSLKNPAWRRKIEFVRIYDRE